MLRSAIILSSVLLAAVYAQAGFSKTMSVNGSLPRDTSQDYFDIEIKITDITKTTPAAGEDLFKDRLRIWLTDLSSSNSEYVPFEGDPILTTVPFTVRLTSEITQTPNSNGKTDFTYNVRISANSVGGLKDKLLTGGKTSTVLQINYYEEKKPQPEIETKNKTISINTAIVKASPTGVSVSGTHRSIIVKWSPATTTTWSDGSSQMPSRVVAVAVDQSSSISNLPAYLYDSTAATDSDAADGACVYVPDSENCAQCSDNTKHYLNPNKLAELTASGVLVATASASAGELSITGLENGKSYSVFTFYTPGGLERSTCQVATPSANTTWSEHNGEDDAKLSDPKCFIATAAYGSPLHRNLVPLRWFRDRVLLQSNLGKAFVDWYYEVGPRAAQAISGQPLLKLMVRSFLWLPVLAISVWLWLLNDVALPLPALVLIACTIGLTTVAILKKARGGLL